MERIVAGGLTGIAASTIVYPIDLLKTYMTINVDTVNKPSVMKVAQEIVARDGILGLYKGWGLSMAGIAPFIGIKMASFDMCVGLTIGKGPDA